MRFTMYSEMAYAVDQGPELRLVPAEHESIFNEHFSFNSAFDELDSNECKITENFRDLEEVTGQYDELLNTNCAFLDDFSDPMFSDPTYPFDLFNDDTSAYLNFNVNGTMLLFNPSEKAQHVSNSSMYLKTEPIDLTDVFGSFKPMSYGLNNMESNESESCISKQEPLENNESQTIIIKQEPLENNKSETCIIRREPHLDDHSYFKYGDIAPHSPASSSCSEVDVETLPTQPVPKLKLSYNSVCDTATITEVSRPQGKRGRKPSNLLERQIKRNIASDTKFYRNAVNPRILQTAIKKQKNQPKSGRGAKINNSVETSPSSSLHSSRCSSDNEESLDKRANHNKAERNRRQELSGLFHQVSAIIPKIKLMKKPSKVTILKEAAYEIKRLDQQHEKQLKIRLSLQSELQEKKLRLKKILSEKRYRNRTS